MKNRIKPSSRRPRSPHFNRYACGKILKHQNGSRSQTHTMAGIDKRDRVSIPDLKIGREWYFKFDHGYVDLYFVNGAVRIRSIASAKIRLGRMVSGTWQPTTDLSHADWQAIASRMWPQSDHTSIDRVLQAVGSAIVKHYETRYPNALPHILAIKRG